MPLEVKQVSKSELGVWRRDQIGYMNFEVTESQGLTMALKFIIE